MDAERSAESFACYLSRVYVARKGFALGTVDEAKPLEEACDIVLTRLDGLTVEILCVIDREANPDRRFTLAANEVRDIGTRCLAHAGTVNGSKMPVTIHVVEIGKPASAEDRARLAGYRKYWFSKVRILAWALDPATASFWTNAPFGGALAGRPFKSLMQAPRQAEVVAEPPAAIRRPVFPLMSCALLAVLAGVFALEHLFAIDPSTGLLAPSIRTLIALGGLNSEVVLKGGEWYRLVSAVFLHGDAVHLLLNAIALYFAGTVLERLAGRVWFAALFVLGGLSGSLVSMALNPANMVSVGASGAIMCLLAAAYVVSFRLPTGVERMNLQMGLLRVLIPALIPLAGTATGHKVDFAAHLGGAMAGAAIGLGLGRVWPRAMPLPGLRRLAAGIGLAGLCAALVAGTLIAGNHQTFAMSARMIPPPELPKTDAEAKARAAELVAKYPSDPRARWFRALAFLDAANLSAAEWELRSGLADPAALALFTTDLRWRMSTVLALVVASQGQRDEARTIAAAVCDAADATQLRAALAKERLCE